MRGPEVRGPIQNEFSPWPLVQINGQWRVRGRPGKAPVVDWKQIGEQGRYDSDNRELGQPFSNFL